MKKLIRSCITPTLGGLAFGLARWQYPQDQSFWPFVAVCLFVYGLGVFDGYFMGRKQEQKKWEEYTLKRIL